MDKIKTFIQHIGLCFCLMGFYSLNAVAHIVTTIEQNSEAELKSYGSFIKKIADDTTALCKQIIPNEDGSVYKENLETEKKLIRLFKKAIFATVSGVDIKYKDDSIDFAVQTGKFKRDSTPLKIMDPRIQNLMQVCKNIAYFTKNSGKHPTSNFHRLIHSTDTNALKDLAIVDLFMQDEFSYLQNLVITRITFGYLLKFSYEGLDKSDLTNHTQAIKTLHTQIEKYYKTNGFQGDKTITLKNNVKVNTQAMWDKTDAATSIFYASILPPELIVLLNNFSKPE